MTTDSNGTIVEFQLTNGENVGNVDADDDDDDDEAVLPLIALGGALPSQALRDAQSQFDDALIRAVQLANDSLRYRALLKQLETLENR